MELQRVRRLADRGLGGQEARRQEARNVDEQAGGSQ